MLLHCLRRSANKRGIKPAKTKHSWRSCEVSLLGTLQCSTKSYKRRKTLIPPRLIVEKNMACPNNFCTTSRDTTCSATYSKAYIKSQALRLVIPTLPESPSTTPPKVLNNVLASSSSWMVKPLTSQLGNNPLFPFVARRLIGTNGMNVITVRHAINTRRWDMRRRSSIQK